MKKINIISYNVNGIRSALEKGLTDWIEKSNPDILCIQELKAQPEQIDTTFFQKKGYSHYFFSAQKKGYSGVGIFSKIKPDRTTFGIGIKKFDDEGRLIRFDFGDYTLVNTYFPSGSNPERQSIKMEWLEVFRIYINKLKNERKNLIITGDFNICRLWIDIHNPEQQQQTSGFLPEEREWFQKFVDDGFVDTFRFFNQEPHNYSWWSYRAASRQRNKGWRIDYVFTTETLQQNLEKGYILNEIKQSDHCPVGIEIKI